MIHRSAEFLKLSKTGGANLSVHSAMKYGGFPTIDRRDRAAQRQVNRRAQMYMDEDGNETPPKSLTCAFASATLEPFVRSTNYTKVL
jgi:hypothetical protein